MDIRQWDVYLHYYTAECKRAIEYDHGEYTTIRTHEDVRTIARRLRRGQSKEEIMRLLVQQDTQKRAMDIRTRMAEGSVRLVARLMSMIDIGPLPYGIQGRAALPWDDKGSNLQTILAEYFQKAPPVAGKVKFGCDFTVFNIHRFGGLKIQWTNNLANHLRLMDDDTTLCIFHHVTFLRHQDRFVSLSCDILLTDC